MSTATTRKFSIGDTIKMAITILVPLVIFFLPESDVFTHQLKLFLCITLFAILTFAFENFNSFLMSLALPFAYTLFKVAPAEVVFQPWSTNIVWMVLGGLMLAAIVEKTGLLKRIAYQCIVLTGGTYRGIIIGLSLAGVIMTVLLAGNGIIPMAALAYGICLALDYRLSKEACGIMLYLVCRPKDDTDNKAYFEEQIKQLGKWSIGEIKAAVICILLLIFLLTGSLHKIQLMWGFAIVPLIAYLPGMKIFDNEDIKKLNFTMVFFTAACMSIGTVGASLGIGKIMSTLAMPIIAGKSDVTIFFMFYVLMVLLNFLMTPIAIAAAFNLPFAEICMQLGINHEAFFLFETITLDQIFLPYEYVMYLVVFSFGMIRINDFIKIMTLRFILATAYIFLLLIPYWKIIGFFYA